MSWRPSRCGASGFPPKPVGDEWQPLLNVDAGTTDTGAGFGGCPGVTVLPAPPGPALWSRGMRHPRGPSSGLLMSPMRHSVFTVSPLGLVTQAGGDTETLFVVPWGAVCGLKPVCHCVPSAWRVSLCYRPGRPASPGPAPFRVLCVGGGGRACSPRGAVSPHGTTVVMPTLRAPHGAAQRRGFPHPTLCALPAWCSLHPVHQLPLSFTPKGCVWLKMSPVPLPVKAVAWPLSFTFCQLHHFSGTFMNGIVSPSYKTMTGFCFLF